MLKKGKVIKAQWGIQFGSSPLASLNPAYSANKPPDFTNSFKFQTNGLGMGPMLNFSSTDSNPDHYRAFGTKKPEPLDPNTVHAEDVARLTGADTNYTDAAVNAGVQLTSRLGEAIPGAAGQAISKVAGSAGSALGSIKDLKEIHKLQGAGVQGLGKAKTGNAMALAGMAADLVGGFLPEKTEYSGDKGNITQTMDTVYDGISDAAMAFGPVGMIVGGAMKGANLLGKGFNALGGGTDGMTTQDAILGSSFLSWNVGLINGFGGKKADTITKNEEAFENVGSSYTGTGFTVDSAVSKSGKKYGLLSSGARNKANDLIAEAKRQQTVMEGISDAATDRRAIRDSMAAINGNRRGYLMQGGYDQSAIRVGRRGMSLQTIYTAKHVVSALKYQKGGKIEDPFDSYLESLPENQRNDSNFRVRDYWEFNGKPKDFDEAVVKGMFTKYEDGWHANSVAENPATGEIEFMKSSTHPSHQLEVDWYNSDEGAEFRSQYELQKSEPYWKYVKRKTSLHKEGGILEITLQDIPAEYFDTLQEVQLDSILPEFKEGGKVNVIPEGALHARLHHMENAENLTKKGIPVVVEKEGGELEQQAEIEREEIIFRLEVTKKLEELLKQYNNEELSQKEKDNAAIEAGKLLTYEILNNTIDNTNNLL